jgi:hypothetical protein
VVTQSPSGLRVPLTLSIVSEFPAAKIGVHGKQAAVVLIVRVLACVAEGLGIRAPARVFEVEANTVLHWLVEAAEHLRAFAASFLRFPRISW